MILLMPMVLVLCTLLYFKYFEEHYVNKFARMYYKQRIESAEAGFRIFNGLGVSDSLAFDSMIKTVAYTDAEPGVYARMFDTSFNCLLPPSYDVEYENVLLEFVDTTRGDWQKIREKIESKIYGKLNLVVKGRGLHVTWWTHEYFGQKYYIIIGINAHVLREIVNMNHFTLGIVFICLLMIIVTYANIYVQGKYKIGMYKED